MRCTIKGSSIYRFNLFVLPDIAPGFFGGKCLCYCQCKANNSLREPIIFVLNMCNYIIRFFYQNIKKHTTIKPKDPMVNNIYCFNNMPIINTPINNNEISIEWSAHSVRTGFNAWSLSNCAAVKSAVIPVDQKNAIRPKMLVSNMIIFFICSFWKFLGINLVQQNQKAIVKD